MKSLQHVLWRGALALSLVTAGIGSGLGMPPAEQAASPAECADGSRALVADQVPAAPARGNGSTLIVLRRAPDPAG